MKYFCSKVSLMSLQQLQDGYVNNNSSSVSQPATPGGTLPVPSPLSPSPASLSSYHGDDSDSISSPPWPLKTPCSPVRITNNVCFIEYFCNYLSKWFSVRSWFSEPDQFAVNKHCNKHILRTGKINLKEVLSCAVHSTRGPLHKV